MVQTWSPGGRCQVSPASHEGKLSENRKMLKGRRTANPVQHTVPNTNRTSCLMAADLATHGSARAGAGLVFQLEISLPPSELVNLLPEYVIHPYK